MKGWRWGQMVEGRRKRRRGWTLTIRQGGDFFWFPVKYKKILREKTERRTESQRSVETLNRSFLFFMKLKQKILFVVHLIWILPSSFCGSCWTRLSENLQTSSGTAGLHKHLQNHLRHINIIIKHDCKTTQVNNQSEMKEQTFFKGHRHWFSLTAINDICSWFKYTMHDL